MVLIGGAEWPLLRPWRFFALAVWGFAVSVQGAAAQSDGKFDNPVGIPSSVQPGAIEAQYEVEVAPDFSVAPAILSPYEVDQPENAEAIRFVLNDVVIEGGGAIQTGEILAVYADKLGSEIPLSDVFGFARDITGLYAQAGYPLSLAYVPIQEIDGGVVRIRIIEGYIGEIDVIGAAPVTATRLRKYGEKLKSVRPLTQSALERYLLLANQVSGVKVTGVLEQPENPNGGVKLTLKTNEKNLVLVGGVNNRASSAVGREQFYARLGLNGIFTGADTLGVGAVQSFDLDELTYLSGNYATVLTAEGLTVGLSATRSVAAPGIPFLRDLGFETQGWTTGLNVSYPVVVRRGEQLTVSSSIKWKEFRSAFDETPNTFDRLWTTELDVSYANEKLFNGKSVIRLSLARGWDVLGATRAGDPAASRNGAGGEFVSFQADLSRNQTVNEWLKAIVAVKAQGADVPLLSSEQCGFGGAGFGRGYDPFAIAGDRCIVGLVELQASPDFLQRGKLKARPYVSFDAGAVRQNGLLAVGEDRTESLYSVAVGARVSLTKHVSAGVEGAVPLKRLDAGDSRNPKFFFSLEARY